ncbi:MAG: DUF3048 domain-containing protein, partial [Anaerolineales bacterium]
PTPLPATSQPTAGPIGPDGYPAGFNPFTGLAAAPEALAVVPAAIKISNFPAQGRPHAGLSYADLVYEYFIGVGMTRFLAIFYGEDALLAGPIRSGRVVDGYLVRMYGAVLGMKGADAHVGSRLHAALPGRVFNATSSLCPALCPYTTSHTYGTFSDTGAFRAYAEAQGAAPDAPDRRGMRFDATAPETGDPAARLWIFYALLNQVEWQYDEIGGAYLRWQDNADGVLRPMPDRLTGETLAFENVVVLFAEHEFETPTIIEMDLSVGRSGPALALRDGRMIRLTWNAPRADSPLRFSGPGGEPFPFKPGSTWFEIVGLPSLVEEIEPGSWKVRFYP